MAPSASPESRYLQAKSKEIKLPEQAKSNNVVPVTMGYIAIEFQTLDGTTIRGRLYAALRKGPAVIMCSGFNCVMDMVGLPEAAELFQIAGVSVLQYDPHSTGASGGTPRNQIDPTKQVEDLSDALTWLSSQPSVDSSKMGVWGFSLGGTVALCAAALDKRAIFVIATCPLSDLDFEPGKQSQVLAQAIKDRESQLRGNLPFTIPMLNEKGENTVGFGHGLDKERYGRLIQEGHRLAPNHVNRVTLQTYYKIVMWQPFSLWQFLAHTPVMFVTAALDQMSYPHLQKAHFERLSCPKRLHIEATAGHEDILSDAHIVLVVEEQIRFIQDALSGSV